MRRERDWKKIQSECEVIQSKLTEKVDSLELELRKRDQAVQRLAAPLSVGGLSEEIKEIREECRKRASLMNAEIENLPGEMDKEEAERLKERVREAQQEWNALESKIEAIVNGVFRQG
jgi:tRNA U34 5-carboxymethylaminomethyl modifying GTPase MnmE/TrmE